MDSSSFSEDTITPEEQLRIFTESPEGVDFTRLTESYTSSYSPINAITDICRLLVLVAISNDPNITLKVHLLGSLLCKIYTTQVCKDAIDALPNEETKREIYRSAQGIAIANTTVAKGSLHELFREHNKEYIRLIGEMYKVDDKMKPF